MAGTTTVSLLLLLMWIDTVASSHFRGGIIMTRPLPGGSQNEASSFTAVILITAVIRSKNFSITKPRLRFLTLYRGEEVSISVTVKQLLAVPYNMERAIFHVSMDVVAISHQCYIDVRASVNKKTGHLDNET